MDETAATGEKTIKELIFEGESFVDVSLPAAGSLRVHPYISCGALEAFARQRADPEKAFQEMVAASVDAKPTELRPLAVEDADVVARLLAEKEGFLEQYVAHRGEKGPFEAFSLAFFASDLWRDHEKSVAELERYVIRQAEFLPKISSAVSLGIDSGLMRAVKAFEAVPRVAFPDRAAWLDTRCVALQVSSLNVVPKLLEVDRIAKSVSASFETWSSVTRDLGWAAKLGEAFRQHSEYLGAVHDRTLEATAILKSHAPVFAAFERLAETFRVPRFSLPEQLGFATEAFVGSDTLVRTVNEFFARPVPRPEPLARPSVAEPRARQAVEADSEIEEAADETIGLVHTTTRELIVVGSEALDVLGELVGDVVDERLKPYAPLLERMMRLAKPKDFIGTLRAFAQHFQRDHWKALWHDVGKVFKPKPEEIAQAVLSMYLQGQFDGMAFVGRELQNGDGFVDVLVDFLGVDYVVEVKIVGGGSWGIGRVKDGLDQLDEYVKNYACPAAYLLVFDGRLTDRGEKLESEYRLKSGATAHVVTARSYFDGPSTRKS